MNNFVGINISFAFNWIFLVCGFVLILTYVFFNYKITIPPISKKLKALFIIIRSAALLIILILIFEPKINLNFINQVTPVNLMFIDNSSSIAAKDSVARSDKIKSMVADINNSVNGKNNIYLFSGSVGIIAKDSLNKIDFTGNLTNLENIFTFISKNNLNPSTVTIISDGIINDGENPYYSVRKIDAPVFSIGVGDTSNFDDIVIKNIITNKLIYANEPTMVKVTIFNKGLTAKSANISFFDNNKFVDRRNFLTNKEGINNLNFSYIPLNPGQTKLTFKIDKISNEVNTVNNNKSVFINVLKNKLNVLLIGGSPSADYSFIQQSLKSDSKLKVNEVIHISNSKILNFNNIDSYIDSSNIIYLIGLPTSYTPQELLNKISSAILMQNKSFFFLLSPDTDLKKLGAIQSRLPFLFYRQTQNLLSAQPNVKSDETGLLKVNGNFHSQLWNTLPPISISSTDFRVKPGAFILSSVKVNNQVLPYPLITCDNLGSSNTIAVLGFNIWKWKLQASDAQKELFDSFILNSVKWLNNSSKNKLFYLQTDKKVFELGETVNISAQLYDQTLSPIDNAEISSIINTNDAKFKVHFSPNGNGIYSGKIDQLPIGSHKFIASAKVNGKTINNAQITVRIENSNIEQYNTRMNKRLLQLLSKTSNGKYFDIDNYKDVISKINRFNSSSQKEIPTTRTYDLLNLEWLLALVILLFGSEWFLRKRAGLM